MACDLKFKLVLKIFISLLEYELPLCIISY